MIMGFQHALAMLGGIVSVPLIIGGPFDAKLSQAEKEYLVSAGLISSGLLSLIQIYRLKIGSSGYYLGTGNLHVYTYVCMRILLKEFASIFYIVPIANTHFCLILPHSVCHDDAYRYGECSWYIIHVCADCTYLHHVHDAGRLH